MSEILCYKHKHTDKISYNFYTYFLFRDTDSKDSKKQVEKQKDTSKKSTAVAEEDSKLKVGKNKISDRQIQGQTLHILFFSSFSLNQ